MLVEDGKPDREEPIACGGGKHVSQRIIRSSRRFETRTATLRHGPHRFPVSPTLIPFRRRRPPRSAVPVQSDKGDQCLCASLQFKARTSCRSNEAAPRICQRKHRIVSVRPQDVVIGNVRIALDRIAVGATEQKIVPVHLAIRMQALGSLVFDRQADRQPSLTVAAVLPQPVLQVANGVPIVCDPRGAAPRSTGLTFRRPSVGRVLRVSESR